MRTHLAVRESSFDPVAIEPATHENACQTDEGRNQLFPEAGHVVGDDLQQAFFSGLRVGSEFDQFRRPTWPRGNGVHRPGTGGCAPPTGCRDGGAGAGAVVVGGDRAVVPFAQPLPEATHRPSANPRAAILVPLITLMPRL